jgi:hypothetical protein
MDCVGGVGAAWQGVGAQGSGHAAQQNTHMCRAASWPVVVSGMKQTWRGAVVAAGVHSWHPCGAAAHTTLRCAAVEGKACALD